MSPRNRRPLILDDQAISNQYEGRASFIASFIEEWGKYQDWSKVTDVLTELKKTFGLGEKIDYQPSPAWRRTIKSFKVNNVDIYMNGNCWYDYNTNEFLHDAIECSNGNQRLMDICNRVRLHNNQNGRQVTKAAVSPTDAKNAKALKLYLESKGVTVPKEIKELAASCIQNVDWRTATGYIAQYLEDHGIWVPNDILSTPVLSHTQNSVVTTNFTNKTLFTELWNIYTNEYPDQGPFQKKLLDCILSTAKGLYSHLVLGDKRPILLLGNVQSGKTNAFEKIIALCFDYGFEVCIVLTKNSKKLLAQTKERIENDLRSTRVTIPDCYDIADKTSSDLIKEDIKSKRKLIVFSKKQKHNLEKLGKLTVLSSKKTLIVDDEADNISVGFYGTKVKLEIAECAKAIENLRSMLKTYAYLQVTATCFNILLQPVNPITVKDREGKPLVLSPFCPSEVEVLPTYPGYKGVDEFFPSQGKSPYWVSFNSQDNFTSTQPLTSHCLYRPILEYLMVTAVLKLNTQIFKTCALIHMEVKTNFHEELKKITKSICEDIRYNISSNQSSVFNNYVNQIYSGFPSSGKKYSKQTILNEINCNVNIKTINSEGDYNNTTLRNGANIFIGAYMLDRGLTFDHLIAFIYGRNSYQQDTVMQHARFFGNRSAEELEYTRLYMTEDMLETMKKMHHCDKDLRLLIATKQAGDRWDVLRDSSFEVCSRNKILGSDIAVLENNKTYYTPKGMQIPQKVDLTTFYQNVGINNPTVQNTKGIRISFQDALNVLDQIKGSYVYASKYGNLDRSGDIDSLKRALRLPHILNYPNSWNEVIIHFYPNRNLSRNSSRTSGPLLSPNDQWISGVLTGHGLDLDRAQRDANNNNLPVLILTEQAGQLSGGWVGYKFIWPALVLPSNNQTSGYQLVTTNN